MESNFFVLFCGDTDSTLTHMNVNFTLRDCLHDFLLIFSAVFQHSICNDASKVRSSFADDKDDKRKLQIRRNNYPLTSDEQMDELENEFLETRRIKFVS